MSENETGAGKNVCQDEIRKASIKYNNDLGKDMARSAIRGMGELDAENAKVKDAADGFIAECRRSGVDPVEAVAFEVERLDLHLDGVPPKDLCLRFKYFVFSAVLDMLCGKPVEEACRKSGLCSGCGKCDAEDAVRRPRREYSCDNRTIITEDGPVYLRVLGTIIRG